MDFKARLRMRAYLARSQSPLGVLPADLRVGEPLQDEHHAGRWPLEVIFSLPRGRDTTLVSKAAALNVEEI